MAKLFEFDVYSPKQIADRVENIGLTKARLPFISTVMLGLLAGGFISFGALYFTLVTSDPKVPFAIRQLIGGLSFSLGLILVVLAGAELFTGNNLLVIAWVSRKISSLELLRNWFIIWISNAFGALGLAVLVSLSQYSELNNGLVGIQAVKIASIKVSLPFWEAFIKGVLCNILVCLAVWISMAGRSVTDKVFAIIFPVSAFVAAGFEHSVANMYYIPLGIFLKNSGAVVGNDISNINSLDWIGYFKNIIPVTLGNIIGGGVLVALVYYLIYIKNNY